MIHHGKNLRKGRYSEINRPYLITTVTQNRKSIFSDFNAARILVKEFQLMYDTNIVSSLAWVIMPDHFHWLFVLNKTTITDVIHSVKGKSTYRINMQKNTIGSIWQKGFHDHATRKDEDLQNIARYIIANPLRANLVKRIGDYPHWDAVWLSWSVRG